MPKHSILIARFPYGGMEDYHITNYMMKLAIQLKKDKRFSDIMYQTYNDTPITMTRNRAGLDAIKHEADFIMMIDNDMWPDYDATKPFFDSSIEFMLKHDGPCVVAAPYCGPPPHENIFVFLWRNLQSDHPSEIDLQLQQYTREEAAVRVGIEEVAALPTGLILMHTDVLKQMPEHPWFYYEYEGEYETEKGSTEDVTFTRDCSLNGIPVYCNWDSWAGHAKRKIVGKPRILTADTVSRRAQMAVKRGITSDTKMTDLRPRRKKYGVPAIRASRTGG